jgi:hypothetical protein
MAKYASLIPQCITSSINFIELNEASKRNFEAKINYCLEIEETVNTWLKHPTDTLESLLDDLELDGFSILSTGFGDTENHVSAYIFHSCWSSECSKERLNQLISLEARNLLGNALPSFNAPTNEIIVWLQEWVIALDTTIHLFITAQYFDLAIASMITLDSLMLAMLCVVTTNRLNPLLNP